MCQLDSFSAGYYIAGNIDVRPFSGENAAIPHDLHDELEDVVGYPVYGRIAGVRHRLRAEHGIPGDTVAVPGHDYSTGDDAVLIEKPWAGRQWRGELYE